MNKNSGRAGYEAILVERSLCLCKLNASEIRVPAGHVLMIKPDDWHSDHRPWRAAAPQFISMHFFRDMSAGNPP